MNLDARFERMVREHQHGMFVFALGLSGSRADAEDIAQDAFVRAYRALRGWDPDRLDALSERPWLRRICLNTWKNRVRAAVRRPAVELLETVAADPADGPEEKALAAVTQGEVWRAVAELPESQRVALTLRWVDDLSYAEVAEVMEMPVGTVKSHVSRGLAALRRMLVGQEVA
jgi:RNA polymerase sigma factor (sigma-70 family)